MRRGGLFHRLALLGAASSIDDAAMGCHAARMPAGCRRPTQRRLIRDHGAEAYSEARQRERDVILPDGTTHAGRTPDALAAGRAHRGEADRAQGRAGYRHTDARAGR